MNRTCDNCGNQYDGNFAVVMKGVEYMFDCFQCAINRLAPHCAHCDALMIGQGVERNDEFYCCNHCALHGALEKERAADLPYHLGLMTD